MENIIELKNITKSFPGVIANDNVSIQIKKGEVHALVGENGAGKSTLMNILYGMQKPDTGEILLKGESLDLNSPRDAIDRGLGMVHQHFMLVPSYTASENIFLGDEPTRFGVIDRARTIRETEQLSSKYHLDVNPRALIRDLPVGIQQRVEILKALHFGADVIILDEPTAVLTPQESDELFNTIRALVKDGKTILFITHKLYEVKAISDRVTVLRKGKIVDTVPTNQVTEKSLAKMMVGSEVIIGDPPPVHDAGDTILNVENIKVKGALGNIVVHNVSFKVCEGEIVTIAGVEGNGQKELIEAITGLRSIISGKVFIKDEDITGKSPDSIRRSGLAHVPGDRMSTGANLDATVAENLIARWHRSTPINKNGWLVKQEINSFSSKLVNRYQIKTPGLEPLARTLSGGNLQKVVVARELSFDSPFLVVAQPTRGIDISSAQSIRDILIEMRNNNRAILVVSTDLDEVFIISDRIIVMFEGKIVGEFLPRKTSREELGLYMIGSQNNDNSKEN